MCASTSSLLAGLESRPGEALAGTASKNKLCGGDVGAGCNTWLHVHAPKKDNREHETDAHKHFKHNFPSPRKNTQIGEAKVMAKAKGYLA